MAELSGNKTRTKAVSAGTVRDALRLRYAPPAFALFEEVGNGTGSNCSRHADAVAVGLWPSRGLDIEGIEVKVSRSDWLSELGQPEKADAIAKFCDKWWLAVGDEKIVQPGELPANWGLLVLRGDRMVCKVEAPKLEPQGATRTFVAALLRRADETIGKRLALAKQEGIKIGEERGPEHHAATLASLQRAIDSHLKAIEDFEEKSGIKLDQWSAGDVGQTVRDLLAAGRARPSWKGCPSEEIDSAAEAVERHAAIAAKSLRGEAERLRKIEKIVGSAASESEGRAT